MKRLALSALLLAGLCSSVSAQPPVTTNLRLRLEAASGYNDNGGLPAVWNDLSGNNNHVTALNATTAEPLWVPSLPGIGYPGVQFDGTSDVMTRIAGITSGFTGTNATIFIVRIANTAYTTLPGPYATQWNAMIAIGDNNTFNNDFGMMGNWGLHSTTSGNWVNRDHPCYRTLPDCRPAVLAAMLRTGIGAGDLDYYVNGVVSPSAPVTQGSPAPFTAASRGIAVGATWSGTPGAIAPGTYFQGAFLEILAYDRALSMGEIAQVNQYLMNKYSVLYACASTRCDPDFSWSMSTAAPNSYTFTAQNSNLPYQYQWTVNGVFAGTGPVLNRTFPVSAPASYNVCLSLLDCSGKVQCSQCFNLCHGDMGNNIVGCGFHFTVSGNTNTPMQVSLAPVGFFPIGTTFYWEAFNPPSAISPYYATTSLFAPVVPVSTAGYHMFRMSPSIGTVPPCYRVSPNHCFYDNQPSPYKLAAIPSAGNIALSIVPNPASALVNLQLSQPSEEILLLRITDMSGKTVYAAEAAAGTDKIQVALDQFAVGMYLVQLRGRNVTLNGKFSKQ